MSTLTITVALFISLCILLFFNVPLIISIGLPTGLIMLANGAHIATLAQRTHASVDAFTLMAIPFFMLAGKLMEIGGMSQRIVRLADCLVGWIRGGLAHVTVVSCAFFGALSGSAAATCAAIGSIMIPEMKKRGYPSDMVAALNAISGGLGVIIPPSIPMVMYGVTSSTSVGALFIAGIVPGLVLAMFLMSTVSIESRRRNITQKDKVSWGELGSSLLDAIPALLVPFIILGGIYSGIFTPTEAGAAASLYGFLIGVFWYKEINYENIIELMGGAVTNTVLVMTVIAASGAFSWLLTSSGVSKLLGNLIGQIATNKTTFLIISNIILLFVGCFIETVAGILIVTPILFPIAIKFGVHPVHFGIIMVVNLAIGLVTPPVGENQYIAAAIAGIPFDEEVKASIPFLVSALLALIVITFVPELSLWLPRLMGF